MLNLNSLKNAFALSKPKMVIHLAWAGIPNFNNSNLRKNIKISNNLIYCMKKYNCKKILISGSCAEYDGYQGLVSEKLKIYNPTSILGKQKNKIKTIFFSKLKGRAVIIWMRIFYVFGKFQIKKSLIMNLIKSVKKNIIINFKNPYISHDYIFVDDVIKAILILVKQKRNTIVNICNNKLVSNLNFVKNFKKAVKKNKSFRFKINLKNRANKKSFFYGCNKKLKNLGWKADFSLFAGIKKTIYHYEKQ